jgi:solute carrier family 50 protein (sugar transporter)
MDEEIRQFCLHHLVPGLGCVVALTMFASPLQAVLLARKQNNLGDLNPIPFVAIIANCICWIVYGCINTDPYVIAANQPGLLLGAFMSLVCYGLADLKVRVALERSLIFFLFVISSTCIYMALLVQDHADQVEMAGYLAVFILLIYYAAPLSVLAKVVLRRNSASLYWPLSVTSCVNGSLWVAYGMAVGDLFVWGPNAIGAALGALQLLLVFMFPANKSEVGGEDFHEQLVNGDIDSALQAD